MAKEMTSTQLIFVFPSQVPPGCCSLRDFARSCFALLVKYDPKADPNADTTKDVHILVRRGYRSSSLLYRLSHSEGGGMVKPLFLGTCPLSSSSFIS
jgi:hypothetical protein